MIMRRIGIMCMSLFLMQALHAGMAKDLRRVGLGVGIGSAVGYGLYTLQEPHMVEVGIINQATIPVCVLLGAAVGGLYTSYGKSVRAYLHLKNLDQKLINVVMHLAYGKTPLEVIDELQDYYEDTAYPLLVAVKDLIKQEDYLGASIELLECAIDLLDEEAPRKDDLMRLLDHVSTARMYVRYVLEVIKEDPRFSAMLKIKGMQDLGMEA